MRYLLGKILQWFRAPGFVRPFQYRDPDTGEVIAVRTSPRYTILSLGGKEFFFLRESGKFDGVGAMSLDE